MRLLTATLLASAWGAALYGASQLHHYDLNLGHDICGPWGCAASIEALVGAHALWWLLLTPLLLAAAWTLSPSRANRVAWGAVGLGLVAAVGLIGAEMAAWLWSGGDPRYVVQRGLFVLATTPDLPALPLAAAGVVGLFARRRHEAPPQLLPTVQPEGVEADAGGGENQELSPASLARSFRE
ncbi:MAG: hypothetical protein AAFV43_01470 [Planctomycetota bacterium]